ncbi:MAG TPA: hypothetical protein VLZ12_10620 [Verrucomicrobiae bacterium]|nr:hypothetical protein [Verrucomicrobiae bacterium]
MAAIPDTLVIVRRLLLVTGWALVIVQLALGSVEEPDTRSDWMRARQQVRARVLEARRAQSIQAATNSAGNFASETTNQIVVSATPAKDCDEANTQPPEHNAP